jgi:hypothetical protein
MQTPQIHLISYADCVRVLLEVGARHHHVAARVRILPRCCFARRAEVVKQAVLVEVGRVRERDDGRGRGRGRGRGGG